MIFIKLIRPHRLCWEVQTFHASLKNAQDIWQLWDFDAVHDLPIRIHQIRMENLFISSPISAVKMLVTAGRVGATGLRGDMSKSSASTSTSALKHSILELGFQVLFLGGGRKCNKI